MQQGLQARSPGLAVRMHQAVGLAQRQRAGIGRQQPPRRQLARRQQALDEHLALEHSRNGLPVSIVRYFNSYGPRIDERGYGSVVANFLRQALAGEPITLHGDGSQTRCFTFVDDTVEGTVRAATMDAALGAVFNVGNDSEITVAEPAALVKRVTGSDSDVVSVSYESRYGARFEDTRRRVPDLTRAAAVLGYRPSVALEDGLRRTLEWWRQEHR